MDVWYIEDDHRDIVFTEFWQKAQEAQARKRKYLETSSVVMEINDANYPYRKRCSVGNADICFIRGFIVMATD